jgi:hypothetical protein
MQTLLALFPALFLGHQAFAQTAAPACAYEDLLPQVPREIQAMGIFQKIGKIEVPEVKPEDAVEIGFSPVIAHFQASARGIDGIVDTKNWLVQFSLNKATCKLQVEGAIALAPLPKKHQ